MSAKKMTKEVIVILVVIAAALIYLLLQGGQHTHYTVPNLEPLDQKGLTRLVVEKVDETISLENRDGSWILAPQGFPTDKEKVQKAVDAVGSLKLEELISRSGNEAIYDLSADKRIRVSLYKGDELLRQIDFGKGASTYRHTFVRLKDQTEIYQAAGSLRSDLEYKFDEWRDKVIFRIDSNEVTGIRLASAGQQFEFKKKVTQSKTAEAQAEKEGGPVPVPEEAVSWEPVLERPDKVRKDALDSLLTKLQELRCDRFETAEVVPGEVLFELEIEAASKHTLTLFKPAAEDASEILARSSQSPYLFYLSKWSAEGLKKTEADLFDIPDKTTEK